MNIMHLRRLIRWLKTSVLLEPVLALIDGILFLVDQLASIGPEPPQSVDRLLLIRLDVFGDYIMVRNYLRYLRTHPDFRTYRFTLLGNVAYKPLADAFEQDVIDAFIWVDIYKLTTNPVYRFRMIRQLRQQGYAVAFSSTYSRIFVLDDFLIRASAAPVRIGCVTDYTNCKPWEAAIGNRFYTRLLSTGPVDEIVLELERNRRVFSALLGQDLPPMLPHFADEQLLPVVLPDRYLIVSPGAGFADRIWPINCFAEATQTLCQALGIADVVVTGTRAEQHYARQLRDRLPASITLHDTTGQYKLPELLSAIKRAELVLANDSGTVPLAIAMQTPCVVVSPGKSLLRWHPYPPALGLPVVHVYPDEIEPHRPNLSAIASDYQLDSPLSVKTIRVEPVVQAALKLLSRSFLS